jgi:hypothetical protein
MDVDWMDKPTVPTDQFVFDQIIQQNYLEVSLSSYASVFFLASQNHWLFYLLLPLFRLSAQLNLLCLEISLEM